MIQDALLRLAPFSGTQLAEITRCIRTCTLTKDENLLKEGQVCDNFFFVEKGGLRHYAVLDDGAEATLNLGGEGDWLFDHESLMAQKPSRNVIHATEDSTVGLLSLHDCHRLIQQGNEYFRLGRILEQGVRHQPYVNSRLSPEEKYGLLMTHKPALLQKFPLKYVASYLEMTPETLSRVRRKFIS